MFRDLSECSTAEVCQESPRGSAKTAIPCEAQFGSAREWARALGEYASRRIVEQFLPSSDHKGGNISVIDLFSGCGGLSTGFHFVGQLIPSFRLDCAIDIDPHSVSTYARNLGPIARVMDLAAEASDMQGAEALVSRIRGPAGGPTVLIGGPPCQGFSAHRKKSRQGEDARNDLVNAFSNVAVALQPDFIAFENVPEVAAKRYWHHFSRLKQNLENNGYIVKAQVHNLAHFGAPQARFRTLVLASKRPFSFPEAYLDRDNFKTVRDAIGHLPMVKPSEVPAHDPMHYCTRHRAATIEVIKQIPKNGGSRPKGIGPECLDRVDGFRDVYGRMYWDRPANTITAYARNPASGRYAHPEQDRGLTIREAALLQSFPKSFHFDGPFDDKFSQIGNAVPPSFSAFLAAHVLGELRATEPPPSMPHDILEPTSNSFSSGIAGRKKG